jgi:hypothetical protein
LKPLPNGCLGIIIKINLTTNYQLLFNCNKVHRAATPSLSSLSRSLFAAASSQQPHLSPALTDAPQPRITMLEMLLYISCSILLSSINGQKC